MSLFAAVSVPENANATVQKSSNDVRDFGMGKRDGDMDVLKTRLDDSWRGDFR